jgi:hypothetical protein
MKRRNVSIPLTMIEEFERDGRRFAYVAIVSIVSLVALLVFVGICFAQGA